MTMTGNTDAVIKAAASLASAHHAMLAPKVGHVFQLTSLAADAYAKARAEYDSEPVTLRMIRVNR